MNLRNEFEIYLTRKFGEKNGTKSSYIRALELISEKIDRNILNINLKVEIKNLYDDVKKEQRTVNGKYFSSEAPSYGTKGFYSAAMKNYLSFLESRKNG